MQDPTIPAIVLGAAVLLLLLLRLAARRAVMFAADALSRFPARYGARLGIRRRWPVKSRSRLAVFLARRFEPHKPAGLMLTLTGVAILYLVALFSGLTEDVIENRGTIRLDDFIQSALAPWRVEPLVSGFLWITQLGSSPSVIAVVAVATGFLWSQRRTHVILSLWITSLGAVTTTTVGKLLVGRHRPEFVLDVQAPGWAFPSGHATAGMAVYGFIAYAIARAAPDIRERFEIAYWTGILIFLIGFSRILLGVHYLTDVLGGYMVGGFWLLVGVSVVRCCDPETSPGENGR